MIPHKQLFRHDPDSGVYGDCFRTTLACLLDLAPADVPHFMDGVDSGKDGTEAANKWLAQRGLTLISIPYQGELEQILSTIAQLNPGIHYLLCGKSRTGCNHSVICRGDQIVWDPSLDDAGIVGPADHGIYWVDFLAVRQ